MLILKNLIGCMKKLRVQKVKAIEFYSLKFERPDPIKKLFNGLKH